MNIFKYFALLIVYLFLTSPGFSQKRGQENKIRKYKIRECKTHCFLFNKDQIDSANYEILSTKFNTSGYAILQTRFKQDGTVSGKFEFKYWSNSLQREIISYGEADKMNSVVSFEYDKNGNIHARKENNVGTGKTHEMIFEWDTINHISRTFILGVGKRHLTGIHWYDKNRNRILDSNFNAKGELSDVFLYEYDSTGNQIKFFKLKDGDKTLLTAYKYNSGKLLIEEKNIYSTSLKLWDASGMVESYKKGDRKIVNFAYDDRGLIMTQTETINDKLVSRIEYKYIN